MCTEMIVIIMIYFFEKEKGILMLKKDGNVWDRRRFKLAPGSPDLPSCS